MHPAQTLWKRCAFALCGLTLISCAVRPARAAGTEYRHPLGFVLTLPAGWQAAANENGDAVLAPPDRQENEAIVLTAVKAPGQVRVTDPETVRAAEAEVTGSLPFLRRAAQPQSVKTGLGDGLRLAWEGTTPGGAEMRAVACLALFNEHVLVLLSAGAKERVLMRDEPLKAIFASFRNAADAPPSKAPGLRPAAPRPMTLDDGSEAARAWRERLSGKKLTVLSSYGSGSGGYSSQRETFVNSDGTYVFRGSSSVAIYVDGANGGSASRQAAEGRWRIFSRGGKPVLELSPNGAAVQQYELTSVQGKTYLNGTRTFVTDP